MMICSNGMLLVVVHNSDNAVSFLLVAWQEEVVTDMCGNEDVFGVMGARSTAACRSCRLADMVSAEAGLLGDIQA